MDSRCAMPLLLLLACCAHQAPSEPIANPGPAVAVTPAPSAADGPRERLGSRRIVCTGEGAWVVISAPFPQATYLQDGRWVGSSDCGGTRMAVYSIACEHNPSFELLFAGIPGPPLLGGKSAQLRLRDGQSKLLDCRDQSVSVPKRADDEVVCISERAAVVLDSHEQQARAFYENEELGLARCAITASAEYRLTCTAPKFTFRFAEIPGPKALEGKSAELTLTQGAAQILDCFAVPLAPASASASPRPRASATPGVPHVLGGPARAGICASGRPPCGNWCCGSDERCCNAGPGPACVSAEAKAAVDDGSAIHLDACTSSIY